MKRNDKLKRLRTLQAELDTIRQELGVSKPSEVLYLAPLDYCDEELIVVADGFGAATTSVVEGNYPIDFFIRYEKEFASETGALRRQRELQTSRLLPRKFWVDRAGSHFILLEYSRRNSS